MIRKVVDTNYLKNPALKSYLEESKDNFALLTDYSGIESYKEKTGKNIYEAMEIVSQFPNQVLVLTNTIIVCGIIPHKRANLDWLIDREQSSQFPHFCESLKKAQMGEIDVSDFMSESQFEAQCQMKRVLSDTDQLFQGMNLTKGLFEEEFSPAVIKELRITGVWSQELKEWIWKKAKEMTVHAFDMHPSTRRIPRKDERSRTFHFRNSLCALSFFVNWMIKGSPQDLSREKLGNDIVDVNFAAYGTFFDGLLTEDKKMLSTYNSAKMMLDYGLDWEARK